MIKIMGRLISDHIKAFIFPEPLSEKQWIFIDPGILQFIYRIHLVCRKTRLPFYLFHCQCWCRTNDLISSEGLPVIAIDFYTQFILYNALHFVLQFYFIHSDLLTHFCGEHAIASFDLK